MRLPGEPGVALIGHAQTTPVLIMTSYASLRSAVDAMKMGAVDYIAKPFDHQAMLDAVAETLRKHKKQAGQPAPAEASREGGGSRGSSGGMVGESPVMRQLFGQIQRVAPTDTTVLVGGESGTGKELVAKALHAASHRASRPMVSVNCAAIPETLIESELFGHEKGAFTGAVSARNGLLEEADSGTLFLDEIGELPLEAQARLLRVLQEGEIRRVGSTRPQQVDVRLIAATHRDLRKMADEGTFREDLYYRLHVVELRVPPLRERGEDIVLLAQAILEKVVGRVGRTGMWLAPETLDAIRQHPWRGNVRELENAVERAVVLGEDDRITPCHAGCASLCVRDWGRVGICTSGIAESVVHGRLFCGVCASAPGQHERDRVGQTAGYQPEKSVGATPAAGHCAPGGQCLNSGCCPAAVGNYN